MRIFIATIALICLPAFAQEPQAILTNATVTAGKRDVVKAVTIRPSKQGGDVLALLLAAEGIGIEIELPDGRRLTQANALSLDFQWEVFPQGKAEELILPLTCGWHHLDLDRVRPIQRPA